MSETNVRNLRNAMHTAQTWLIDLTEKGSFTDEAQAYRVLRAVLQSLRDRLTVEEAAHLPMVIRGVYYDGFRPSELPRNTFGRKPTEQRRLRLERERSRFLLGCRT